MTMGQARTQKTLRGPASIGLGWRAFQVGGLLIAASWLFSYVVFLNGFEAWQTIFGLENPIWITFGIGYFFSPLLSIVLIAIAVWPGALALLNRGDRRALIARVGLFLVPTMWLGSVFVGDSAMIDAMIRNPLGHSRALPVTGGAFFHVVFQHWFQGFSAMLLALVPSHFATLTNSDRPAGTGAVVREVSAQMDLEERLAALRRATKRMMQADSPGEVATIGAEATEEILDVPYSRVHLHDEDSDDLVPAAWTDDTERVLDGVPPTVEPGSGPVWETFRDGEANFYHNYDALDGAEASETPLEDSLLLPLGDHGIMLVQATDEAAFSNAKLELARVLSENTQAALSRTEREHEVGLVRELLDHASETVFVIDPESGEITDSNDHAIEQLGYDENELQSMHIGDVVAGVEGVHGDGDADDTGEWIGAGDGAIDGTADDTEIDVETLRRTVTERGLVTLAAVHRRADGSTLPVELTLNLVGVGGDREYLLAIARDVTDRQDLKRELAARRVELDCLGFVQTLVDEVVHAVWAESTREEIELQACEVLADSPYYADAWLVDPGSDGTATQAHAGTADGGKLRTVDDLAAGAPATGAIQDTIGSDATTVIDGPVPDRPASADEPAVALPLNYGAENYGAFVVVADRSTAFSDRERAALETLAVALALAIHVRVTDPVPRQEVLELEFERSGDGAAPQQDDDSTPPALVGRLGATLGCPVSFEGLVPGTDDRTLHYYVAQTDVSPTAVRQQVLGLEGVEDCRVTNRDGDRQIEVHGASTDILSRLVADGAIIREATAEPATGRLVLDVPPDGDAQELTARLQAADDAWTRTATRRVDRPTGRVRKAGEVLEDSLTDRQREALLAAYFSGYYDHPRSNTAQEVATTLAVSDSTLFQHLQVAQRKLIEAWFDPPS